MYSLLMGATQARSYGGDRGEGFGGGGGGGVTPPVTEASVGRTAILVGKQKYF